MNIPQIEQYIYSPKVSYSAVTEEDKILNDILPQITTFSPDQKIIKNDINFIKENVVPPFFQLYRNWPDAYKLSTNKNLKIIFNTGDEQLFEFYADYVHNETVYKNFTFNISSYPDKSIIFVRAKKYGDFSALRQDLYCAIMQHINNAAVKDMPNKSKDKSTWFLFLSGYLDKKYAGKLTLLSKHYMQRQDLAKQEFEEWLRNNKKHTDKKATATFINIMNKNRCWALRKLNENEKQLHSLFCKKYFLCPYNAKRLLVCGLASYFGSPEEKRRLKDQEFALYDLIERVVVPMVKKAAQEKQVKLQIKKSGLPVLFKNAEK